MHLVQVPTPHTSELPQHGMNWSRLVPLFMRECEGLPREIIEVVVGSMGNVPRCFHLGFTAHYLYAVHQVYHGRVSTRHRHSGSFEQSEKHHGS